tara:strand:- start:931 stop:1389 length:459 start_codon:yes stop_codon:yes gene_type:complete
MEMEKGKEEVITAYTEAGRNEILRQYANFSFKEALEQVKTLLDSEKDFENRLALLAAKSWILRKKIYVSLHDPYISALSEVENTDIFDGLDDEDYNEFDSLFDDAPTVKNIEVTMLKAASIDGKKLTKETIVSLPEETANKFIEEGKAKLTE